MRCTIPRIVGEIDKPNAVLCMSNLKAIPKDESELMSWDLETSLYFILSGQM